jgi:hypothetical protein
MGSAAVLRGSADIVWPVEQQYAGNCRVVTAEVLKYINTDRSGPTSAVDPADSTPAHPNTPQL